MLNLNIKNNENQIECEFSHFINYHSKKCQQTLFKHEGLKSHIFKIEITEFINLKD